MADSRDTSKSDPQITAPVVPVKRSAADESDTALERAVEFDDDHLPRDTAPLDRADLDALRALADSESGEPEAGLGGPTDELDLSEFEVEEDGPDDTMNDTVASVAVPDED